MRTKIGLLAGAVAAGAVAIWGYQGYAARHPGTDDAYVGADVVRIAPRVAGRVLEVPISDQQQVKRGQLLFRIDPATFRFSLEQARARLALARRQVSSAQAAVESARAEVHNREVLLANARAKAERTRHLISQAYTSKQSAEDAEAEYKSAEANLGVAHAQFDEAQRQLGAPGDANDRVIAAQAALDQAQWNLDNTEVDAPCDGQVGQMNLRPGSVVSADSSVFVVVCARHYWVDANFKETELEYLRVGQPAEVEVDMYPGHTFHGTVESISAASGSAFSLLPPQNASGNWVKVTQRVPVRIRIDDPPADFPLRVGTSAVVSVDARAVPAKPAPPGGGS